ncbi:MAG: cation:proton antiporter [Nanoarchaeota archaeon]
MQFDIINIGLVFFFAIVGGLVAAKTKLPPALGLLLVGAIIGPNMLGYISHGEYLDIIIEVGAVLLLFVTGLEFEAAKIRQLGSKALIAAVLKIGIVFFLGYHATLWLGYGIPSAVLLAIIISFSSTIVIVKILEQHEMIKRQEIPLLVGILVVEDILAVFTIAFIEAARSTQNIAGFYNITELVIFSVLMLVGIYLVSLVLLRPLISWVVKHNPEAVIFVNLVICIMYSGIAYSLGLSSSIGAFLAGSLIASMPSAHIFEKAIVPFSMVFSSLFFLAIGTLIQYQNIIANLYLIAALIVVLLVSRFIGVGLVTNIFANFKTEQAVFSSFAMFSVGEFSLLIARHAKSFDTSLDLVSLASSIIVISAIIMALTIKQSQEGFMLIRNVIPSGFGVVYGKLRHLADYLNHGFQEMSIETTESNMLKKSVFESVLFAIIFFFAVYFWKRLIDTATVQLGAQLGLVVIGVGILICSYKLISSVHTIFRSAAKIFSSIHLDQNKDKATRIILYLIMFFLMFVISLYSPFFIFLFGLGEVYNTISLLLFIISILLVTRVIYLIESCYKVPIMSGIKKSMPRKPASAYFTKVSANVPPPSKSKFRFE